MKISVSLSWNVFEPLTYRVNTGTHSVQVGMRVLVPLGNRFVSGWIVELDSPYPGRLKHIIGLIDDPFPADENFLRFARQSASAYFTSAGVLLDHSLPASRKNVNKLLFELDGQARKITDFSPGQMEKMATDRPLRFFFKERAAGQAEVQVHGAGRPVQPDRLLLGSERGHDYRQAMLDVMAGGKSVLLLVPDNASARYWKTIWPEIDIYNSETRTAAKENIWTRYQQGKTGIVCGGLSAAMLPLPNLGLLIVDRASSPLYQRTFRAPFKTDHLGRIRARAEGIPILQGAAAHSCATYSQREHLAVSDHRQGRGITCQVHMLKGKDRGIPDSIIELINQNYLQKKKTLVLVNKIEPSRSLFCANCSRIAPCPGCGGILQVDEHQQAACRRCSFSQEKMTDCARCKKSLALLHDISLTSLARAVVRTVSEQSVLTLSAANLKDMERILPAVRSSAVVIATPAAINPYFRETFSTVIYIKPESFFSMDEFNSAEMIYATSAEIRETLLAQGEMHVFSVFHFHYALQFLMDEDNYFERELKYRQWFMLPPFSDVYQLEIRDASLRSLAAAMRGIYGKHKNELQIKKIYLVSRQPLRGLFRGVLELHAPAEKIIETGLQQIKKSTLSLLAG